jgi:hypothetical protein
MVSFVQIECYGRAGNLGRRLNTKNPGTNLCRNAILGAGKADELRYALLLA